MPKSLAQYWDQTGRNVRTGNKKLSQYYADQGQGFTDARQIADAIAANIDEYPRGFTRSFVKDKLRLKYDREFGLLSDALYVLKQRGLVEYDHNSSEWRNLQR